jgi:prophage regulatory protein
MWIYEVQWYHLLIRRLVMAKIPVNKLLRLPAVLALIPVSRATWYSGVKSGRYPQPVKLSTRIVAWRAEDIRIFIENLS